MGGGPPRGDNAMGGGKNRRRRLPLLEVLRAAPRAHVGGAGRVGGGTGGGRRQRGF